MGDLNVADFYDDFLQLTSNAVSSINYLTSGHW